MNNVIMNSYVRQTAKKHLNRAIDDAYWLGAAFGMMAGACLGVIVGLVY